MKERPIIFSTESVKQILSGAKTQTRRVMKPQPKWLNVSEYRYDGIDDTNGCHFMERLDIHTGEPTERYLSVGRCSFGKPGDRLWVREAFWIDRRDDRLIVFEDGITSDKSGCEARPVYHETMINDFDALKHNKFWSKKSPLFMPRWASRLTLEITNVRCERVQDINEFDAEEEGVEGVPTGWLPTYIANFAKHWDSLNAKRGFGWDTNCWVWCISFKTITNGE